MGKPKFAPSVLICAAHHHKVASSRNLTRTILSTGGQEDLEKQAQANAISTANNVV